MSESVERARRVAIEALVDACARDVLPDEEFERRVAAVRAASSLSELRALLVDLPGRAGSE